MRNKTLAVFCVVCVAVAIAVAQVPGIFSQISIGSNVVIPSGTAGYTGSGFLVLQASPSLSGVPTAPTASPGTNTTQIATTAFVQSALSTATTKDQFGTLSGCAFPNDGGGLSCTAGTIIWPTAFTDTSYIVGCWPMYSAAIAGGSSTQPVIDLNATINSASQITLIEGVAQGSSGGFGISTSYGLTIVCHAHHS